MCFSSEARSTKEATRSRWRFEISGPISFFGVVLLVVADGRDGRRQVGDELVVDLLAGVDAAGGGAVLAGIVVAEGAQAVDHGIHIGVVEDDDRGLAAEFEMRALDRLGRGLQHLLAGGDVAGDRDHVDLGVVDQRVADAVAAAEHDVDDAFGQDVGHDFRELQRRQRRLLGRLEHHRVAAADRRRQLPGHHHQRIVPRRDRGDDADRVAADHRGVAGNILAGDDARHGAHRAREEAVAIDDRRDLVVQHRVDRLAAVQRLERGKTFRLGLDALGDLQEIDRALRGRGARPGDEGFFGSRDRSVDLAFGGFRQVDDLGPGPRD